MNTRFQLLVICSLICNVCFAQKATIDINAVKIFKKTTTTNGVALYSNKSATIAALGNPVKTSQQYSEMSEKNMDVLEYAGKTKLYFLDDALFTVDIGDFRNSPLTVGKDGKVLKTVADFNTMYSNFYKLKTEPIGMVYDAANPAGELTTTVATISKGGVPYDVSIYISYILSNGPVQMLNGETKDAIPTEISTISIRE